MLGFLKEVWCSDDNKQFKYLLMWYANVLKGNKNQAIVYSKSIQGVGKSTFNDFFVIYVLGKLLYAEGDKNSILSENNMNLLGKPFVVFEELPTMNKNEWAVCDSRLKDMATGTEMEYSNKYINKFI